MNHNLHSSTKLTEFAREFEEEPETIFTKFVNKITNAYNNNYIGINVIPPNVVTSTFTESKPSSSSTSTNTGDTTVLGSSVNRSCSLNNLMQSEDSSEYNIAQRNVDNSSNSGDSINRSDELNDTTGDRTPLSVLQRISNIVAIKSNVCFK